MIDFNAIYLTYHDAIFLYVYNLLRHDKQQAEDLTQETFLSFYNVLPALEAKGDIQAKPYLYRSARNKAFDYLRHKHLIEFVGLDYDKPGNQDFTEQVALRDALIQTLSQLSPSHRTALLAWAQRLYGERPSSSYKMAASRARKAFQEVYRRQEVSV